MCFKTELSFDQNFSWCIFFRESIEKLHRKKLIYDFRSACFWALQNATFKGTIISYYRIHWLTGSFDFVHECSSHILNVLRKALEKLSPISFNFNDFLMFFFFVFLLFFFCQIEKILNNLD